MSTLETVSTISAPERPSSTSAISVQVCVLTYKRPDQLRRTIESLMHQRSAQTEQTAGQPLACAHGRLQLSLLVVDNDAALSGQSVVQDFISRAEFPIRYLSHAARGIAGARNRALEASQEMNFVAFLDDDETADEEWLARLVETSIDFDADVTTGPVKPHHENSPGWVKRGCFFDPAHRVTGSSLAFVATNNVLLRNEIVKSFRFDPRFDATGGEDTDFFLRIRHAGLRLIWAQEAVVTEAIPASRANLAWILNRARSDANRFTRVCLYLNPHALTVVHRLAVACAGLLAGLVRLPLGLIERYQGVRGLQLIYRSFGTLSALRGRQTIYYGPAND